MSASDKNPVSPESSVKNNSRRAFLKIAGLTAGAGCITYFGLWPEVKAAPIQETEPVVKNSLEPVDYRSWPCSL